MKFSPTLANRRRPVNQPTNAIALVRAIRRSHRTD
jgi:hypothetical protein